LIINYSFIRLLGKGARIYEAQNEGIARKNHKRMLDCFIDCSLMDVAQMFLLRENYAGIRKSS
jgi:hypothetical protein